MPMSILTNHRPKDRHAWPAPTGWHLTRRPEGWLELRRPWDGTRDPLAEQADWAGPVKLAERHGQIEQRVEFFLGTAAAPADEEEAEAMDLLAEELIALGGSLGDGLVQGGWAPPPAETVVAWLNEAGHETAIDKERNIRLTLKRVGCDGEVRVTGQEDRLRLVLPLGSWPELEPTAESAMRRVAGAVNTHSRLLRVAVHADGAARCFEAQVDLTGLPLGTIPSPPHERLGCEMVRLAVVGLELALRQLGLELPLLADPRHRDLAELLLAGRK